MRPPPAKVPRALVAAAVRECLQLPGRPIREIRRAAPHKGDPAARPFRDRPVWHSKPGLDRCVAARLKLDEERVAGPLRDDGELYAAVSAEISRLRRSGHIQDWRASSGLGVWRLARRPLRPPPADLSMSTAEGGPFSGVGGGQAAVPDPSPSSLYCVFAGIIRSGRKDSTYKFALARALLDYCHRNRERGSRRLVVPYRLLAMSFAEYYWRLDRVFKLNQAPKKKRTPAAVSAVRSVRPSDPPESYLDLDGADRAKIESAIMKSVFGHARKKTSLVVPRFQNVACGPGRGGARWRVVPNPIFYEYSDDDQEIRLLPEAYDFFRSYYYTLMWVVLDGWAEFIKKSYPRSVVDDALDRALSAEADLPREPAEPDIIMERAAAAAGPKCRLCGGLPPEYGPYGPPPRLAAWSRIFCHDMVRRAQACPECGRPSVARPPEPRCSCGRPAA